MTIEQILLKAIREMKSIELTVLYIVAKHIAKQPLPIGTISTIKLRLETFINKSQEVISKFGVEVDEIQNVYDGLCHVKTKIIKSHDGGSFETIPDEDHWKKVVTIAVVMGAQHEKLVKYHPDIPYIHKFIHDFKGILAKKTLFPNKLFIDRELTKIIALVDNFEVDQASAELFKFRTLYNDLTDLKKFNSPFFKPFVKKIQTCLSDQYHGIRLEIGIANKLQLRKIQYSMPDPPDFLITWGEDILKIECTSRHLSVLKDKKDVIKGFITSIESKKKCSFVDSSSALFIDASNLSYNNPSLFADQADLTKVFLKEQLEKSNFGNLTVFSWIWNIDAERYENIYNRIDANNIFLPLKEFLDSIWPFGNTKTGRCAAPIIG